jgi:hypothetical protein
MPKSISIPQVSHFVSYNVSSNGGKMKRTILIAGIIFLVVLRIGAQSKPFIGYDKVPWGASAADVRAAYGIADTVQVETDKDDSNISSLIQENVGGGIYKREFLFNGGKLYRVEADYTDGQTENPSFDLLEILKKTLAQRYGNPTNTITRNWDYTADILFGSYEMTIYYTGTQTIYGKFAPDIEVELQYIKAVPTDAKQKYTGLPSYGLVPVNNRYTIRVCYTWKKFSDQYKASKVQL